MPVRLLTQLQPLAATQSFSSLSQPPLQTQSFRISQSLPPSAMFLLLVTAFAAPPIVNHLVAVFAADPNCFVFFLVAVLAADPKVRHMVAVLAADPQMFSIFTTALSFDTVRTPSEPCTSQPMSLIIPCAMSSTTPTSTLSYPGAVRVDNAFPDDEAFAVLLVDAARCHRLHR